jgi:RimJ/RimL family protein N-acetyltransferase
MTKIYIPPIDDGRIRLRTLEEADLPMTLRWRNQDHIRKWFIHSEVISPESHQAWFKQYQLRNDDFVFIIEDVQIFYGPVGQVSLYNINWIQKQAEFGRLLIGHEEAKGKGIAKRAAALLLEYARNHLGLQEFTLEVMSDNTPAIAIYQAVGFLPFSQRDNLIIMRLSDQGRNELNI